MFGSRAVVIGGSWGFLNRTDDPEHQAEGRRQVGAHVKWHKQRFRAELVLVEIDDAFWWP